MQQHLSVSPAAVQRRDNTISIQDRVKQLCELSAFCDSRDMRLLSNKEIKEVLPGQPSRQSFYQTNMQLHWSYALGDSQLRWLEYLRARGDVLGDGTGGCWPVASPWSRSSRGMGLDLWDDPPERSCLAFYGGKEEAKGMSLVVNININSLIIFFLIY